MGEHPPRRSPTATAIKIVRTRMSRVLLLADEGPDAIQVLVFVAGLVTPVQYPDVALAVDDHRAGHTRDVVGLADRAVLVIDDRETDGSLLQEAFGRLRVGLHVHADQRETHLAVLLVDVLEQGHFLAARSTPAGPEIEHHHLALVLGEADFRARARVEGELRRWSTAGGCVRGWHSDQQRSRHGS